MKKNQLVFLFILSLVLSACSNSNATTFTGESENWKSSVEVSESGNGEKNTVNIEYIGSETPPNEISYTFDTGTNGYFGTTEYKENGIEWETIVCRDCVPLSKDREFEVEIEWDGKKETFNLSNIN